ncbi:hypothetical protein FHS83_003796 [Rhizomicrobium palustre]|uniref:CAAX prenyl protease 2/Lysostaphin resistance protein A-like domain-containing protein n=1 Tax=Rhizomicrobium palustre TaxID=189966 RepID=A0A846N3C1_9PROT|nr:CPBP family intramembrane glutamic endopeptidase [Rhizomicrobium palustre]NIK90478.1 hypothetical protein [Rhizomicrobium palustre]
MIALLGTYLSLALCASPALFRKQTRGWVFVLLIVLLGDFDAIVMGSFIQRMLSGGALHYTWFYKGFSVALNLVIAITLIAMGKFRARELGLTFVQAPGTGRAVLTVILPIFLLQATLFALHGGSRDHSLETLLFQATMPGLSEELLFRGLLLALFDRMFAARFRILGAELSYGAIVTSLAFGLLHALPHDANFAHLNIAHGISAAIGGFLLVWLRCRSRSLVLPVVVHNLFNLLFHIVPKVA